MASVRLGAALRQIRGLFEAGTVAGLTDGQLLDRYLTRRDESAFAALVMRHGPMVLGVCRAVLRGSPEVEDAFQATFLVLIRKASTIRGRDAVGGWLYRVAHRVAVQAGRDRSRKDRREHPAGDLPDDIVAGESAADDDWRGTLHEELARLPERLRQPVVLCYLEGRTHAQAARELSWSEATLRRRLANARDLLHSRLTRRGVAVSVAPWRPRWSLRPWPRSRPRGSMPRSAQQPERMELRPRPRPQRPDWPRGPSATCSRVGSGPG